MYKFKLKHTYSENHVTITINSEWSGFGRPVYDAAAEDIEKIKSWIKYSAYSPFGHHIDPEMISPMDLHGAIFVKYKGSEMIEGEMTDGEPQKYNLDLPDGAIH